MSIRGALFQGIRAPKFPNWRNLALRAFLRSINRFLAPFYLAPK
jgi:hypothetical protein